MDPCAHIDHVLQDRLQERRANGLYRTLHAVDQGVDFCSNDYLGFARSPFPQNGASSISLPLGATGSRLIAGNPPQADEVEEKIAAFHDAEAALVFTSGYAANLGLLSSIATREDVLILDAYAHASLIDGARLSPATRLKFRHNDLDDLEKKLSYYARSKFVVVESLYSMHGDEAPLADIAALCRRHGAMLLVDEAHATGVYGARGEGLTHQHGLQNETYARIHTFGKALGLHGAAVVGSAILRDYLINYARSFIYTTGLPPLAYVHIGQAYDRLPTADRALLRARIARFGAGAQKLRNAEVVATDSPIQSVVVGDNARAKALASSLQERGFFTKAILSPTVPKGQERLRICLHTFNADAEIDALLDQVDSLWV